MTLNIHRITKKRLKFKIFLHFWVNSDFSPFFGQNWNFCNFLRFFKILPFFYAEYWKSGCRWALGFYFIWKKLFKSFISGVKLVCEKNIRKVFKFWKNVQKSMKIPNFAHFWPNFGHFWPIFAIFFIFSRWIAIFYECVKFYADMIIFGDFWGGGHFWPPPE